MTGNEKQLSSYYKAPHEASLRGGTTKQSCTSFILRSRRLLRQTTGARNDGKRETAFFVLQSPSRSVFARRHDEAICCTSFILRSRRLLRQTTRARNDGKRETAFFVIQSPSRRPSCRHQSQSRFTGRHLYILKLFYCDQPVRSYLQLPPQFKRCFTESTQLFPVQFLSRHLQVDRCTTIQKQHAAAAHLPLFHPSLSLGRLYKTLLSPIGYTQ
jgi:hypothetical protein